METFSFSNTPFDSPISYDPAWRHEVAKELINVNGSMSDLYPELATDEFIANQYKYISSAGDTYFMGIDDYEKANNIYAGDITIKGILEALLLTKCSIQAIAQDFATTPEVILLYSALFFNIRDTKTGARVSFPALLTNFAKWGKPIKGGASESRMTLLKYKACRSGVQILIEDIGWYESACAAEASDLAGKHETTKDAIKDEIFVTMLNKMYSNTFSGRELVDLHSNFVKENKDIEEIKLDKARVEMAAGAINDTADVVAEILEQSKFGIEVQLPYMDDKVKDEIESQLKIKAETFNIEPTDLELADNKEVDKGKRLDDLSNKIANKLKEPK